MAIDTDTYHTPSAEDMVKMSASLRAGTYDAGANLLRTCSLPDLTSLAADDPGPPAWDIGRHRDPPEAGETDTEPPETGGIVSETEGTYPEPSEFGENIPEPPKSGPGDSVAQEQGGDSDSEPREKDDVFYEDVIEEGEGGVEGGENEEEKEEGKMGEMEEEEEEEEEDWSSSEDEDLQQLVQTLQTFVNEASECL